MSLNSMLRRLALLAPLVVTAAPLAAQTKLLRYPDVHGEELVFTYGGDLWRAPVSGGSAVRLTAHPGLERPKVVTHVGSRSSRATKPS